MYHLISRAFWKKLEPKSNLERKIVALAIDAEALPTKQKTFLLRVEPRVFSPTLVAKMAYITLELKSFLVLGPVFLSYFSGGSESSKKMPVTYIIERSAPLGKYSAGAEPPPRTHATCPRDWRQNRPGTLGASTGRWSSFLHAPPPLVMC